MRKFNTKIPPSFDTHEPKQKKIFEKSHGTNGSYTHLKCRCKECVEAHRIACADYRARNRKSYNKTRNNYYHSTLSPKRFENKGENDLTNPPGMR
jgi:hypothetical protein